jgi:excisionase family DNA binding protein
MTVQVDSMSVQVDSSLSVQEAAARYGVSEKTIRRRIKSGTLPAFQQPTSQGFEWRVQVDGAAAQVDSMGAQVDGQPVQVPPQTTVQVDSTEEPAAPAAADAALLKSLDMVDRLQRENLELAGQVGFLQAKLQAAEQRILLLEAQSVEQPTEIEAETKPGDTQAPGQEETRRGRPWWRRLFGSG